MSSNFYHSRFSKMILVVCIFILVSALTTASVPAQVSTGENQGDGPSGPNENVLNYIPIQGRLTNAAGVPLNGNYDIAFRLYTTASGGIQVCSDTNLNVAVTNGLFSTEIWGNCASSITGEQLYLGIEVEGDGEMSSRQPIFAVPYAWSLRPSAVISGTIAGGPVVHIENSAASGRGLRVYATDTSSVNYGIVGASKSLNGYGGYFYNNGGGVGLWSWSNATDKPAIFGCINSSSGSCSHTSNPAGVIGVSSNGDGVQGITSNSSNRGVYAGNTNNGIAMAAVSNSADTTNHTVPTLYLVQSNASGDYVVGASTYLGTRDWRVDRTGQGFFNGGTQNSGADFAEQMTVNGSETQYEPGDVLVISSSADRMVELSSSAFSKAVFGVYSTDPAVLAGAPDSDNPLSGIPVAIVGIVPCKVSAENGAIQRGDLLVTATMPGHAMRAGENPPQGTVLGKALQPLDSGTGIILILVVLQ
jgi:hypothetical protein